jgi:hypothetical protein
MKLSDRMSLNSTRERFSLQQRTVIQPNTLRFLKYSFSLELRIRFTQMDHKIMLNRLCSKILYLNNKIKLVSFSETLFHGKSDKPFRKETMYDDS